MSARKLIRALTLSLAIAAAPIATLWAGSALAQSSNEWEEPTDPTDGFDFGADPDIQRSDQPIPAPDNNETPSANSQPAANDDPNAVYEVDPDTGFSADQTEDPNGDPDTGNDTNFGGYSDAPPGNSFDEGNTEDPSQVYEDGFQRDENGAIIAKPGTVIDPETGDPVTQTSEDTRIANRIAVFSGLDKITGNIITFDVYVDETVQFGVLQVTPRVCYSRPPSQTPKTDAFIEVDEQTLDRKIRRIFTGWMFADSPGLNAIEHPIYDIWLKGCKMDSQVPAPDGTISSTNGTNSQGQPIDENGEVLPPMPELASVPVPEHAPREELSENNQ